MSLVRNGDDDEDETVSYLGLQSWDGGGRSGVLGGLNRRRKSDEPHLRTNQTTESIPPTVGMESARTSSITA